MVGNKKVIGICMAKVQDPPRSRTVEAIAREANAAGFKVMVFNSSFDFHPSRQANNPRAFDVFDFINYDIVDALIILCGGFLDEKIYDKIIERALKNNVPVVLEDIERDGCYTIKNAFEKPLQTLLNHVIKSHGVRDTFFIAGPKNNIYSDQRIDVYKRVLEENEIPFDESMVDYGGFWEVPTFEVMERLLKRDKLPEAIFCANDAMAVAACKVLNEHGIEVPKDIIVTGFDGSRGGEFSRPRISTCVVDTKGFAKKSIYALMQIFSGEGSEKRLDNFYAIRPAESCGCNSSDLVDFRKMASEYHHMLTDSNGDEYVVYEELLYQLNSSNVDANLFYSCLAKILNWNSVIAFRPSWLSYAVGYSDSENFDTELVLFDLHNADSGDTPETISFDDMIPNKDSWAYDDSIYVINSISIGDMSCGFYECKTTNIVSESQKINRISNLASIIVHMATSQLRQRYNNARSSEEAMIDTVTGLPNLHGLAKWFNEFTLDKENADKTISFAVFNLPKYKYIYENYGIESVEMAMCFVAEALKLANPNNSYVANISQDEFVVVRFYDNADVITESVRKSVSVFYSLLERYNNANGKKYFVEVNTGSVDVPVTGIDKMEVLIQRATTEMYDNKKIFGSAEAEKKVITTSTKEYNLFNTLVSKNLFKYCFQPIVNVEDGSIYAYEALMRTEDSIGFNPMQILKIANEYQRLYDIEKATIFNVCQIYKDNPDKFCCKKVFINCIPGNFLKDEDSKLMFEKYGDNITDFVFEITEHDTITDSELERIRSIGNPDGNNSIAVDDYGVGHSNIVNLIKYAPDIVKIDRFLVTDINEDATKELVVKGVIDFARMHNIKVLAEGVETKEELVKLIDMGVDFIQGYFTGRPQFEPISEINEDVKNLILSQRK